jgi:membrane-bound metal-dependent hydrolase YbcI (DUF457 family)
VVDCHGHRGVASSIMFFILCCLTAYLTLKFKVFVVITCKS